MQDSSNIIIVYAFSVSFDIRAVFDKPIVYDTECDKRIFKTIRATSN